jgi:CO/xanthine dehydrogenase FAD-binding subunit
MIIEYHRPNQLEQALVLLSRVNPKTVPLGGGTFLSQNQPDDFAVVDLANLGLNQINMTKDRITIGSTVTLHQLDQQLGSKTRLRDAIRLHANINTRQMATIGGTLVMSDGSSTFLTSLLACDALIRWVPVSDAQPLGEWLLLRHKIKIGSLIAQIVLPKNSILDFEYIARSAMDTPSINIAVNHWQSGRTRVAFGVKGNPPMMVFDGSESAGINEAIDIACSHYSINSRYNFDYLKSISKILISRLLERIV